MISPIRSRTRLKRPPSASTSATRSAEEAVMGAVEFKQSDPFSNDATGSSLIQNAGSGNSSAARPVAGDNRSPVDCGDFDMRIARDGTWFYRGSLIGRPALVKLFASVLRREPDGRYWLVTPAERGRIEVEDVPFLAVALSVRCEGREQQLIFRTNLDDIVTAGPDNPLRVETAANGEPAPYILVRDIFWYATILRRDSRARCSTNWLSSARRNRSGRPASSGYGVGAGSSRSANPARIGIDGQGGNSQSNDTGPGDHALCASRAAGKARLWRRRGPGGSCRLEASDARRP